MSDAIALHLKALEADATASQAHVNLISLYGRAGAPAEAEAHYRKALSLQTNGFTEITGTRGPKTSERSFRVGLRLGF